MKPWLGGLAIATCLAGAAIAAGQMEPFVTQPGGFTALREGAGTTVAVTDRRSREIARYSLPECGICGGDGTCAHEGAFALAFPGLEEPIIGVSCHGAKGQSFHLLAPKRDRAAPIFQVIGDSFSDYVIRPDRIEVRRDRDGKLGTETWRPGVEQDADEIAWVRGNAASAEGREMPPPRPVTDPDFQKLEARLHEIAEARDGEALVAMAAPDVLTSFGGNGTIEELRQLVGEPWFWDEFARLLAGGGALVADPTGEGKGAVFPAAFADWPDDLDAFSFVYGDREGGVLRAGPSDSAPVLIALHRKVLARGPYLEGEDALRDAGWSYLCSASAGCGYARGTDVRSPIDYRILLHRPGPGTPWVLETLVAGD